MTKIMTSMLLIVHRVQNPPESLQFAYGAAEPAYRKSAVTRVLYLMFAVH